jgi:hypothetical protein
MAAVVSVVAVRRVCDVDQFMHGVGWQIGCILRGCRSASVFC